MGEFIILCLKMILAALSYDVLYNCRSLVSMSNVLCFFCFCFSDTIAEQDLSDLIVPPPQCEFVLFLFLTLAGSLFFNKLEKLQQVFFAGHIPQVTIQGYSIFAPKHCKNSLNIADRRRLGPEVNVK